MSDSKTRHKERYKEFRKKLIDLHINTDYYVDNYPNMFVRNKDGTYSFRKD